MSVDDNSDKPFWSFLSGALPTGVLSTLYNYAGIESASGMQSLNYMYFGMPPSIIVTSIGALGTAVALVNKEGFDKKSLGAGVLATGLALGAFNAMNSPTNVFDDVFGANISIQQDDYYAVDVALLEGPE